MNVNQIPTHLRLHYTERQSEHGINYALSPESQLIHKKRVTLKQEAEDTWWGGGGEF